MRLHVMTDLICKTNTMYNCIFKWFERCNKIIEWLLNAQFFYFWTPSSFIQIYQKFENKTSERFRHGNCVRDEIFWMYKNNMLNKATLDTSDVFFVIKIETSSSEEIYLFTVGIILKLNISYISMQCRTILQYDQWTAWYSVGKPFLWFKLVHWTCIFYFYDEIDFSLRSTEKSYLRAFPYK